MHESHSIIFYEICGVTVISLFKKYLFSVIVTAYVISAVGIPVYLHYCGGELEKVNYVLKSNSCCGGEEDDSTDQDNDCCRDENRILQNTPDFTIKPFHHYHFLKTYCDLFYIALPFSDPALSDPTIAMEGHLPGIPPPDIQQRLAVTFSVLRI